MKRPVRTTVVVSSVALIAISGIWLSDALAQRRPRGASRGQGDSQLEKPPVPRDDNEKKILGILDDILARQRYAASPGRVDEC